MATRLSRRLTRYTTTLPFSRSRRMSQGGRRPNPMFYREELLFRRYCLQHWVGNKIVDAHFKFPPSFNRAKYSHPEDVTYSANGQFDGWGVMQLHVGEIPEWITDHANLVYRFFPRHDPDELNFGHTIIQSERQDIPGRYVAPSPLVRKTFRAQLSQIISIRIKSQV
jgi:hypothetical protein